MPQTLALPVMEIHDWQMLDDFGSILALRCPSGNWPDGVLRRNIGWNSVEGLKSEGS
jgi:hypothetical protein